MKLLRKFLMPADLAAAIFLGWRQREPSREI
jgi:hypothetical protein